MVDTIEEIDLRSLALVYENPAKKETICVNIYLNN